MTKILVCSDLHTNFHRDWGKSFINDLHNTNKEADIIVVAGDLSSGKFVLEKNIEQICSLFKQFVFVSGNHSYYGSSFFEIDDLLKALSRKYKNFHWLDDKRVEIDGVKFIGCTLWFGDTPDALQYKSSLNDFRCITDFRSIVFDRHEYSVKYLENNVSSDDIVVTHHMPSYKCINPKYLGSRINCYFANNLDYIISKNQPRLWIHGHGHDLQDCEIDGVRVLGNPLGYPGENHMFDDNLIIEV